MRLLHLTHGNLFGGVEVLLLTLARADGALGDETHFALCSAGRLGDELKQLGRPVHEMEAPRLRNPRSVQRARRELSELLKRGGYDGVVCHHLWSLLVFGPAVKKAQVPLVCWVHGVPDRNSWIDRLAAWGKPDLVLSVSRYGEGFVKQTFAHAKSAVCYLPVPVWRFEESAGDPASIRAELGTPPETTVVIQVSRMEPGKGHAQLLDALAGIRQSSGWEAWLVGGAQRPEEVAYERELHARAHALNIAERIRFLGDRTDVPALLLAADVFCHPNTVPEGFGIACMEGLYARLPCIVAASGGTAELLDESCAVLVPPGDPLALESALRRLIDDPELRARLGERGQQRALRVADPARTLTRIHETLAGVLSAAPASRPKHRVRFLGGLAEAPPLDPHRAE